MFESWQNSEFEKEKVAVLSCRIGVAMDAAGRIPSAVGRWWETITRITELCKHCARVVMKQTCSSFSLFVPSAIIRLLILDIGMTSYLWKNLNLLHPSGMLQDLQIPPPNSITDTETQMSILKAVNFLLSFL